MEISAKINFKNLKEQKTFDRNTSEYAQMSEILLSGQWKGYAEELVNQGVSVLYVASDDAFVVRPLNFDTENNIIKEAYGNSWNQFDQTLEDEEDLDDDNLDIEAGNEDIENVFEDEVETEEQEEVIQPEETSLPISNSIEEPLQPETNQTNDNLMQVVTLDDVLSIIKEMGLGAQAPVQTDVASMEVADPVTLEGGDEALKKAFFQGEGNEILDSEFEALNTNVQNFENHVADTQSYIDHIDGKPAVCIDKPTPAICPNPNPKEFGPNGFNRPMSADNTSIQTRGTFNDDGEEIDSLSGADRFLNGIPGSDENEPDIYGDENPEQILLDDEDMEDDSEEDEMLTEDFGEDYDFEENGHPDLHRIAGNLDFTPEEEEDLFYDASDFEPDVEEPIAPLVTKNEMMNLSGQQVQIVLTGVMITPVEMNYISESVAKNGGKLKKIEGVDNELKIVLESNKKSFTINYIDLPAYKAPQPFSIKGYKFASLEEALKKINFENNKAEKESNVYKSIMTEGFEKREMNNWNDSDIFEGLDKVNYVSSWSVVNAGTLNLKNGLNESQTLITKLGTEPNTLVKSEEGNYYLIKGNLREASKIGTERELYDARNRKNIDRVTVVGIYENNIKGLGEIMYEIKKTSIQLLSWK